MFSDVGGVAEYHRAAAEEKGVISHIRKVPQARSEELRRECDEDLRDPLVAGNGTVSYYLLGILGKHLSPK